MDIKTVDSDRCRAYALGAVDALERSLAFQSIYIHWHVWNQQTPSVLPYCVCTCHRVGKITALLITEVENLALDARYSQCVVPLELNLSFEISNTNAIVSTQDPGAIWGNGVITATQSSTNDLAHSAARRRTL